ncbi:probable N-acetyltransferase HLS1 [Asparagus officinalis]|uniref:probable N-acetyltransferase HLS1 n=1 Tax=Asparagus officinalis TaxID=4686 RepID=UPI00098E0A06|nr:probable N-acetyltransferase HLS1 [Asparagus officinalis]
MLTIREFDMEKDLKLVEELERNCDIGPSSSSSSPSSSSKKKKKKKKLSLCIDQLGDPLCRIRHAPERIMLVAEYGEKREIVGVIRACIKTVTRGVGPDVRVPRYVRVAYLLGLRVSVAHRRLGIGVKLVQSAEAWCVKTASDVRYMATDQLRGVFVRRAEGREMRDNVGVASADGANMAAEGRGGGGVRVAVRSGGMLRSEGVSVPHWRWVSCEDVWCMKKLVDDDDDDDDWSKSREGTDVLFVDPREF